ncbi:oligosaccharide flippase family protein [Haloferax sp. Atlit-24N]|nr:oligosaccharide flippase family protein [Haloferax sp. Atlit-24N]
MAYFRIQYFYVKYPHMRLGQTSIVFYISNLLASVLGFVATIYFTRLLGPSVFGTYSLIIVVVAWLQFGSELGITTALKKRVSESADGVPYLIAGFATMSTFFTLTALVIVAVSPQLTGYLGVDMTALLLALLGVRVIFRFVRVGLEGQRRVHISGGLEPIQRLCQSTFQISLLALGLGLWGMLAGAIIGTFLTALFGVTQLRLSLKLPQKKHFRSILSFARFSWLDSLRGRSFTWMDIFVLGLFVPSSFVGFYNAAWNVASFLAFGNAVSSAFFPEISEISSNGNLDEIGSLVSDTLAFNGLFLIPGLIGASLLGDRILLVYGSDFSEGYPALVLLIGSLLIYGYFKQLLNTLMAIDRPDLAYWCNISFVGSNTVLNVVLVWQFGWLGAAVGSLIASAAAFVISYHYLSSLVSFTIPIREIFEQMIAATVMGVVILISLPVEEFFPPILPSLVATLCFIGLGGIIYFSCLIGISPRFRGILRNNVSFIG